MPISFPYKNKLGQDKSVAFFSFHNDYTIIPASTPEEYEAAKELFVEYQQFLGEDLCFQSFDAELKQPEKMYGPPTGILLLAKQGDQYIGCVALRDKKEGTCEMKRLYVRDAFKGKGIGRRLAEMIIEKGRELGYGSMILDTLDRLKPALELYQSLGFSVTNAYYQNPLQGVVYMQKVLHPPVTEE